MTPVEALYRDLLAAWNDRDADAFADLFTTDGSLVGFDGSQVESRAAIAEHLGAVFADHEPAAYVANVREVSSRPAARRPPEPHAESTSSTSPPRMTDAANVRRRTLPSSR